MPAKQSLRGWQLCCQPAKNRYVFWRPNLLRMLWKPIGIIAKVISLQRFYFIAQTYIYRSVFIARNFLFGTHFISHCKFYFTAVSFYFLFFTTTNFSVVLQSFNFTQRLWFCCSDFILNFLLQNLFLLGYLATGHTDYYIPGIILGMGSANERRCCHSLIYYIVTFLIQWLNPYPE